MYCSTMLFCLDIYVQISSSPGAFITATKGAYLHVPYVHCGGILPDILHATQWWNTTKICLLQEVTTHVSNLNIRMDWTTAT